MPVPSASPEPSLDTAAFAVPKLGLDEFREAVDRSFVPLIVTTDVDPDEFRGSISQASAQGVSFTSVSADRQHVERTQELIERSPGRYFKISLQLEGESRIMQDGREVVLHPGDLAIYDTSRPYRLQFPSPFRVMVIQMPHEKLEIPRDLVGRMTAVRLGGDEGLGRVVSPFLATLGADLEALEGPAGVRLAASAIDLLETLFAHELDVAQLAADPHRQLMQQIRDHIDAHLGDPDLGPASIAAASYISVRHLHALFQEEGVTVSSYIRSRRLERCYLSLTNPLELDQPIAAIGMKWGFPDPAHFSRVFKTAYQESPKTVRARIQGR